MSDLIPVIEVIVWYAVPYDGDENDLHEAYESVVMAVDRCNKAYRGLSDNQSYNTDHYNLDVAYIDVSFKSVKDAMRLDSDIRRFIKGYRNL